MEIGSAALNILVECWDGHLTPPEVASLADRASRARDPNMVRAAAELALSCLPHAHALNPNEIQRALVQCKEQVVSPSLIFEVSGKMLVGGANVQAHLFQPKGPQMYSQEQKSSSKVVEMTQMLTHMLSSVSRTT